MVLIDLSKAFDSICHSILLLKLRRLGTSSQALKCFESYLTDRKQSTRLDTSLSTELTIPHGVSQVSILGPLLFNLYIKYNLPSAVKSSCTNSYVDDTKIYCSFLVKNMNSRLVKMTEDLHLIAGWCCLHLWYLGVSSPLRRLSCNDTPQVAVGSLAGAGVGWLAGPLLDGRHPVVPRPPSWSLAF